MKRNNYYDVTDWQVGNPYTDIGEVINSIIADIKNRQKDTNVNDGGKPGAVIYIPSGDYHLKTDRKSTRLNSSHTQKARMPSSA